ncbi:MAG: putative CRISPR-associated protein [Pseudomonadota bacterium]|nr:putative CRISPR-associated protein [Pseudomonadota bacterium]MDP1906637.1 putative CRISPR-associated protein [Pseudomonadota bacterium]MDP2354056.1 putative CRISPR-associated protein [Pseudomonadota bacterium]
MQQLIVSTCGTSLITNQAGERRSLVTCYANARTDQDVPLADRLELASLLEEMRRALSGADNTGRERMSAELNGLLRLYGGRLDACRDTHWLIATDTWLGAATAQAICEVLESAGHTVVIKRITDLRTDSLLEFRGAMAELVRLCAQEVRGMREGGSRVVFNLTGGFKSVQGFMQALGMLYADECVYVFERTTELLRLPRLPIKMDSDALVSEHQKTFRRLVAGLPVPLADARSVPDTLLMEVDGQVTLSVWGDVVWAEAGAALLGQKLWEPVDPKLRFAATLAAQVNVCARDEVRQVNQRLAELARHLHEPNYNPSRLDFKKLKGVHGRWTHECDAWATGGAKRLFGYFDGGVFVVEALKEGLH